MKIDKQTFLAAWEAATPLLQEDALMQYVTKSWGMTLPGIYAALEKALASVTTVEALFERLNQEPEVGIIPYAAMLALLPLVDPASQPATHLAGDLTISDTAQVILGNAIISGTVQNNAALIVFGDLTIEGIYGDEAWGYSLLAVGGTIRARGVISFGEMFICGDLLVSEVVHGYYNDYSLVVGGALRTKVLLEEYHHIHCSALEAQQTVSLYDIPRLREVFMGDLFLEEERNGEIEVSLDTDLLFDRLEQGQPIYRS